MVPLVHSANVICPRCERPLRRAKRFASDRFDCSRCEGRVVSLSAVLAQLSREDALAFECAARSRAACGGRTRCPRCLARSTQIQLGENEAALRVDACAKCALVWLDRGEWVQLSRHDQLLLTKQESQRMAARWRLEVSKLGVQRDDETQPPDTLSEVLLGLLGYPIEHRTPRHPASFVTWAVLAGIVLFSVWGAFEPRLGTLLGFNPADPFRLGGITLFTNTFVHGGVSHLLGNAYFLWAFGKTVEHALGGARYALLLCAGDMLGDCAFWMANSTSERTFVGLSSGLSAVIVYHVLAMPGERVKVVRMGRWISVPVREAVGAWVAVQFAGGCGELAGFGSAAHVAHLGGALVGVVAWLWLRSRGSTAKGSESSP